MSLKNTIESMASAFADGLLRALRNTSLDEILAESGSRAARRPARAKASSGTTLTPKHRGGRLARRSPNQIAKVVDALVAVLKSAKQGMRSEELQKALSIEKKALVRPIAEALHAKKIRKTGQKRATKYFAR
jgi:hypothetical protein